MKLREKFPGKTRSRGLKGAVVGMSLNSTANKESIILRITLSEELLDDMNTPIGARVDIDIEGKEMIIERCEEDIGWKIIPSGVSKEHKHGMIVPVLAIKTASVKSDRAELIKIEDGKVRVLIPPGVVAGLGLDEDEAAA
jgi:hypothetical protein